MSGFRITDEDFYLKQKVRKHSAAAVELLLSHRTYISMFEDLEYHVFLESHGTLHHVWQIVDLGLSRRRKKPITAVDEAAVILGGEKQDPMLVSGRLFNVSGGARSEELTSTIISTLIRARWPYEVVGECLNEGLVSRNRWRAALDAFSAERSRHLDEAKRRVAERPNAVINAAKLLGLNPEPTGEHPDKWRAACPGSNHPIFISADEDRWFCGWCRRKGGPDELESFSRERRRKAS